MSLRWMRPSSYYTGRTDAIPTASDVKAIDFKEGTAPGMLRPTDVETQQRLDEMNARVQEVTTINKELEQRLKTQELRAAARPEPILMSSTPFSAVRLQTLQSINRLEQQVERTAAPPPIIPLPPPLPQLKPSDTGPLGLEVPRITGVPVQDEWLNERVRLEKLSKMLRGLQGGDGK